MADWPGWPGWMFERLPPRPAERLHATALCAQAVRPNKRPYLTAPSRPTFCMQDGPRGAAGQPRHPSRRYLQVGTAEGYLGDHSHAVRLLPVLDLVLFPLSTLLPHSPGLTE